jgi:uncharacterized protein (TIGR03083 family)
MRHTSAGVRFRAESTRLAEVMSSLSEDEMDRATPCAPWTVRELLVHVMASIGRVLEWLANPEPDEARVDAVGFYRPGEWFSADANAARIAVAQRDAAAYPSGHAVAEAFDRSWQATCQAVTAEPATRRVASALGDTILLTDFLIACIVELTVHGIDLAHGLGREPWTTPQAAAIVEDLLLAAGGPAVVEEFHWERATLIEKATGRSPLTKSEAEWVHRHGIRWLTLG